MADNTYLLETRLSKAQQAALATVRDVAKTKGLTVFLVGGAVRDLIGGTAVRDLDVVVQGNALKLKKDIEKSGAVISGEMEALQAVYARFPGGVRMEIGSTLTVTYPKPGKAVAKPATILDDLRRRDFTANAMALSLNEGSYGLLMDPLNGVADIENRELRLVSNYGFIEDPVRMIRAARYMARLGWHMDEKTQARYETGKAEGYISAMDEFHRGYETEEIFHEEDALRVMRRLEEEGWMQHLAPALSAAKANVAELERLRESQAQLQIQGVVADAAAANFPLLTAKMSPKDVEALKKSFPRQGFVGQIDQLEARSKEFAAQLGAKGAAAPSQAYKLIVAGDPEAVLWTAHTTKSGALQAKFKSFYTDWPQARQRIPYLQMQEMRITPDLPEYDVLVETLFFELMDGRLSTPESAKEFLEPYSPPAPPPPVSLRRPRAPKKDAKPAKSRKKVAESADDGVGLDSAMDGETSSANGDAASGSGETAAGSDGPASENGKTSAKSGKTAAGTGKTADGKTAAGNGSGADATPAPGLHEVVAASPAGAGAGKSAGGPVAAAKDGDAAAGKAAAKNGATGSGGAKQVAKASPEPSGVKNKGAKTPAPAGKAVAQKTSGITAKKGVTPAKKAAAPTKKAVAPAKKAATSAKKGAPAKKGSAGAKKAAPPAAGRSGAKKAAPAKAAAKRPAAKAPVKKVGAKGSGGAKKAAAKKRR